MIVLDLSDINYVLRVDEPKAPTAGAVGYQALRAEYIANTEKWEHSDRLSLQITKTSISEGIKGATLTTRMRRSMWHLWRTITKGL